MRSRDETKTAIGKAAGRSAPARARAAFGWQAESRAGEIVHPHNGRPGNWQPCAALHGSKHDLQQCFCSCGALASRFSRVRLRRRTPPLACGRSAISFGAHSFVNAGGIGARDAHIPSWPGAKPLCCQRIWVGSEQRHWLTAQHHWLVAHEASSASPLMTNGSVAAPRLGAVAASAAPSARTRRSCVRRPSTRRNSRVS